MSVSIQELEQRLREAFPDCRVSVIDLVGDGDHLRAEVVGPVFAGKSRVEQHKMVYSALGSCVGGELHALSLKTSAL